MIKTILLIFILAGSAYGIFSFFCVLNFFRRKKLSPSPVTWPPVSILKPLKGIESGLSENIRSFARQDYPRYEIVLGSEEDISSLSGISANVSVRTVLAKRNFGANRKVWNLEALFEASAYPFVAISDADMRVDENYLKEIVTEFLENNNTGMVTSLYKISEPISIGAAFESLTIALDFVPSVLVARALEGMTFGLGASMLASKEALDSIGGFRPVADYLADDYQLGNRIRKKGYKIILSRYVLETVPGKMGIADYFRHQLRWARTYRFSRPAGFLVYGITHIFTFSVLFILLKGISVFSLSIFLFVLVFRFALGFTLFKKVIQKRKWLKWLFLLPLKDLFSFAIWAASFFGNKVTWKGTPYRILKGGRMEKA